MATTEKLIKQADELNEAEKYQEVVNLLTDELLEENNSSELYTKRARAYHKLNDWIKQSEDCEKAIKLNPINAEAFLTRGILYYDKKEYDKAISDFNMVVQLNPDIAAAYYNRGHAWSMKDDNDNAINDYTKALELEPRSDEAFFNRGNIWAEMEEYDNAIADFTNAIELNPNYLEAFLCRGEIWDNKNEYYKAVNDYSHVIEMQPNNVEALLNRGIMWDEIGDLDKAIKDYTQAINQKPDFAEAYYSRADSRLKKHEVNEAIYDYTQAINIKPDFLDALINRGNAWFSLGQLENAYQDYDQVIKLNPNNADALNNRGVIFKQKKDIEKAIKDFKTAIQKDSNSQNSYRNLGDIYYDKEDYENALQYYNKAFAVNPNDNWIKGRINSCKAQLDERIDAELDEAVRFIIDLIDNIKEKHNTPKIKKAAIRVLDTMNKIRGYAHVKNPEPLVHYTKLNVADILITDPKSNLRFYNVLHMNDPEEGKIMLDYLDNDANDQSNGIKACFNDGCEAPDGDNNVYLGSFLPAPETTDPTRFSHEDELVLWRTYGKNEVGEEAMGCSIVIDNNYFGSENKYMHTLSSKAIDKIEKTWRKNERKPEGEKYPLYRVLYYDKRIGKIINTDGVEKDKLNEELEKFKTIISLLINEGKNLKEEKIVNQIVYRVLSELRYFFKSADFSYENEHRVIIYANPENKRVLIDEYSPSPKKLYYAPEVQIQPYIKKIYIGPRVKNADAWKMYFDVIIRKNKMYPYSIFSKSNIQVLKSTQKFQ